jgi:sugar lactone lactonase YvrE
MSDTAVEVVLESHASVGEGPVWDETTGTLVWVDIMNHRVHRLDPATGDDRSVDIGQPVGAAVPRQRGGLVLALRDGFAVVDSEWGNLEWVAQVEHDIPSNRMNDGKCDAAGRFWAGTMAFQVAPGVAALYRLDPDYRVTRMVADVTLSNGMDWSLDNRLMYYIDSVSQRLDVFEYDLENGVPSRRRTLVDTPEADGLPDGMTVDVEGGLWVAFHHAGVVRRYTPDGQLDRTVAVPTRRVTSCAFGGPDYMDLYITSASLGMSEAELRSEPLAGALFRCRPGVRGRPSFRFAG